jgi:hypothetical protein
MTANDKKTENGNTQSIFHVLKGKSNIILFEKINTKNKIIKILFRNDFFVKKIYLSKRFE